MDAEVFSLRDLPEDRPVALLARRKVEGEKILFAQIRLLAGCHVAGHRHESEQVSYLVSGKARWTLGEPGAPGSRVLDVEGGNVVLLPPNVWHGVDALEETTVIDILSPPAKMGVDSQGTG